MPKHAPITPHYLYVVLEMRAPNYLRKEAASGKRGAGNRPLWRRSFVLPHTLFPLPDAVETIRHAFVKKGLHVPLPERWEIRNLYEKALFELSRHVTAAEQHKRGKLAAIMARKMSEFEKKHKALPTYPLRTQRQYVAFAELWKRIDPMDFRKLSPGMQKVMVRGYVHNEKMARLRLSNYGWAWKRYQRGNPMSGFPGGKRPTKKKKGVEE